MTRHSKREIERAVDDLAGGVDSRPSVGDVTDAERDAIRAALAYRYANYDTAGGSPESDPGEVRAFLRDASEHVEEPHATTLRDLLEEDTDER